MASNTTLAHIPLNGGQREDIDAKLLPQGLLRRATNLRLRKAGRLGVRKGYTALSTQDVDGNTVRMFDVASHNGVLVGFGTANASAMATIRSPRTDTACAPNSRRNSRSLRTPTTRRLRVR